MEGVGHSGFNPQTGQYGPIPSDVTGMRQYARDHGMSEDFDRSDEATLRLWEEAKDSSCPPKFPYQSYNGTGCAAKPIDSGLNSPGRGRGGGGGGGRGGRGPSAPTAPAAAAPFDYQSFMDMLMPLLMSMYGGGQAQGSFLPGTNRQLDSSLPFRGWF